MDGPMPDPSTLEVEGDEDVVRHRRKNLLRLPNFLTPV